MKERLQKILSAAGVCSRRRAEEYLLAGRVTVNGRPAGLGDKADLEQDEIGLDGRLVGRPTAHTYLMLHKPRGYVTTLSDERGRKTVLDLVRGCGVRVWPVGRLDMDSEGLLLLTNDGAFTHRLTHPSHQVEKEYRVEVSGNMMGALPLLRRPMVIDGEEMEADQVLPMGTHILHLVIHQGKNRQVRRMCQAAGLEVRRLIRVREGQLRLGELHPGHWRMLSTAEVALLTGKHMQD